MIQMLRLTVVGLCTTALALALSACGGSSSSSTSSSSTPSSTASTPATSSSTAGSSGTGKAALAVAADPSGALKYNKTSLSAKAGKVTIRFTNSSPLSHNVTIQQGTGGKTLGA